MTAFVRNRYPLPSENVIANSCVFSHSTGHPHGMVYRRFEHGTVNTPCDEHGTVLASYYATTVCYRILLRHSCENGPPSITVCVAGWSCDCILMTSFNDHACTSSMFQHVSTKYMYHVQVPTAQPMSHSTTQYTLASVVFPLSWLPGCITSTPQPLEPTAPL